MTTNEEPAVYYQDGLIVYRASSLGGCLIALAAARQGLERQAFKEGGKQLTVFAKGHEAEDRFFELNPDLAHYRQMEVRLHLTPKIVVVGHLDAFAYNAMWEVKSQSDKEYNAWTWDSWTDNPLWVKYSWQVSACMHGLGAKNAFVVRFNRETEEWDTQCIPPFWSETQILERVLEVEALADEDKLECKAGEFFCDYPYLHTGLEVTDDKELQELVNEYLKWKHEEDISGINVRVFKEKVDVRMKELGLAKVLLMNGATVSRSEYDVKEHTVKASHQVRLTIKEAKE